MRIERLSDNQFTIFLSFDDLLERGFTSKEIWNDASSIQSLFTEMMHEASSELGFELDGMLFVQVYLMQAQGMHITVTQKRDELDFDDDYIEMKVTLDESKELMFSFTEFENIIQVGPYLANQHIDGGQVFHLDDRYYMLLTEEDINQIDKEDIIAIMSEYSYPSIVTSYRLKEYGKPIFKENAVKQIMQLFYK